MLGEVIISDRVSPCAYFFVTLAVSVRLLFNGRVSFVGSLYT